jgi:hypothetical protein
LNSNQQSWDNKPTLASGRDVRFPGSSVRVEFSIRCEMNQFWPEPRASRFPESFSAAESSAHSERDDPSLCF